MAMPDLGKMYGPLPLGAWIVVVGVGGGIAYWNYRNETGSDPVEVEDGSGIPGVGDGSVGGWQPTSPPVDDGIPETAVTTNDEWGRRAINWLIANRYPADLSDSAIRKYLAGIPRSISEAALVTIALGKWGSPPTPLPPDEGGGETEPPPSSGSIAAPTGLRRISVGKDRVSLRWNPVAGAVAYVVHISPASRTGQGPKTVLTTRNTWYNLSPGTTYYFSVQAKSITGATSAKSGVITVRTGE